MADDEQEYHEFAQREPTLEQVVTGSQDSKLLSENDLKAYFKCPYMYYITKNVGLRKLPRSAFAAESMFFQTEMRRLLMVRDPKIGRLLPDQFRAGEGLKTVDQMTTAELKQYLAFKPGNFGGHLKGRWLQISQEQEYAGSPLSWSYESQGFSEAQKLKRAGDNYQRFIYEQGGPLWAFVNRTMRFQFEGITYLVTFPEVRKPSEEFKREFPTLDDPTRWGFAEESPLDEKKKGINGNGIVTLRLLAFCTLASEVETHRLQWGFPEELADLLGGRERWLDERIQYRHFNSSTGVLSVTQRDDGSLDAVRRGVARFYESIAKEDYEPDRSSCSTCPYNMIDARGHPICDEIKPRVKPTVPAHFYKKSSFEIERAESEEGFVLQGYVRKPGQRGAMVAELKVAWKPAKEQDLFNPVLDARLAYSGTAFGLGFEQIMLTEADSQFLSIATTRDAKLTNQLDPSDFRGAGMESIFAHIRSLGYEHYSKTYSRDTVPLAPSRKRRPRVLPATGQSAPQQESFDF